MSELVEPGGREMNFTPVNRPLSNIVADLRARRAVLVELEPGDATRYLFFLIPMWDNDLRPTNLGIRPGNEWIWVAPVNLRAENGGAAVRFSNLPTGALYGLIDVYSSGWTREVISHFLSIIHPLVWED